jgi:hypothetical protein
MARNTDREIQAGSPLWAAQVLNRAASTIASAAIPPGCGATALRLRAVLIAALLLLPTAEVFFPQRRAMMQFYNEFHYFMTSLRGFAAVLALTAALYSRRTDFARRISVILGIAFIFGVLEAQASSFIEAAVLSAAAVAGSAICVGLLTGVAARWRWPAKTALYLIVLAAAFALPAFYYRQTGFLFGPFWMSFRTFVFLAPFLVAQSRGLMAAANSQAALCFFFNPFQLIAKAMPVPPEVFRERPASEPRTGDRRAAAGLADLAAGCMAILASSSLRQILPAPNSAAGFLEFMGRGWLNYIVYYFGFLGTARVALGAGRWLGFDLHDVADQALFAVSPVDRWKKWNTYFYWFYMTLVWLPLARLTRSILVATLAVFAINFIWHQFIIIDGLMLFQGYAPMKERAIRHFVFYMAHGIALYLSFALMRFQPAENRRAGWTGVAVTHAVMAAVYGII